MEAKLVVRGEMVQIGDLDGLGPGIVVALDADRSVILSGLPREWLMDGLEKALFDQVLIKVFVEKATGEQQ